MCRMRRMKMIKKTPIKLKGNAIKLARSQPNAAFAHGCNCFNTMGKGMAVEVRTTCPDMYKADLQTRKKTLWMKEMFCQPWISGRSRSKT